MNTKTNQLARIVVAPLILAVLTLATIAIPAANAGGAMTIPAGQDSFHTSAEFNNVLLPADFFEPGSDPFTGPVVCLGGTSGVGAGDTIVKRLSDMVMLPPSSSDTIAIELIKLDLVSCEPITVHMNNGTRQLWDVRVNIPSTVLAPGEMKVRRTHFNGGTFDARFSVQPTFTFTRLDSEPVDIGSSFDSKSNFGGTYLGGGADGDDVELKTRIFEFSAHNIPWSVCPGTLADFCPGVVPLLADGASMNLAPIAPPAPNACQLPLPNGGLVVLPNPHQPNPSTENSSAPDQLRRAADRLEAAGLFAEANHLRLQAETIEVLQRSCSTPLPQCGDGIIQEGEDCDDGNSEQNDSCPSTCQLKGVSGGKSNKSHK